MEYINLANGTNLPVIGFGPGGCGYTPNVAFRRPQRGLRSIPYRAYNKLIRRPGQEKDYTAAVASSIKQGFRLIDYSAAYGDGNLVRKGIQQSGLARSELVLTTRVSNGAQFKGQEAVKQEFFRQLKGLGTDYIDI